MTDRQVVAARHRPSVGAVLKYNTMRWKGPVHRDVTRACHVDMEGPAMLYLKA